MTKINSYLDVITFTDNTIEFEEGAIESGSGNSITYQLSDVNSLPTGILTSMFYPVMKLIYKINGVTTLVCHFQ